MTAKYADFLQNFDREIHNLQIRNNEKNDDQEATSNSGDASDPSTDPQNLLISPGPTTAANTATQNKKQKKLKRSLFISQIEKSDISNNSSTNNHAEVLNNPTILPPKQHEITTEEKLNTISTQVQGLTTAMAYGQNRRQRKA